MKDLFLHGNCVLTHPGYCSEKSALTWGLHNGQLTYNSGSLCVVRNPDNSASLAPCSSDCEHIGLEVPTLHT